MARHAEDTEKASCLSRLRRDKQEYSVLRKWLLALIEEVVFVYRYLPIGEKMPLLCVLCASVVTILL
jgi:hypothetical protein